MIIKHATLGELEISDRKIEKISGKLKKQAAFAYLESKAGREIDSIFKGLQKTAIEKLAGKAMRKAAKKAVKKAYKFEKKAALNEAMGASPDAQLKAAGSFAAALSKIKK